MELGSGDDAAVTVPPGATVTSVDLAIEDVHFRRSTAPPRSIGHKALAAALSDLAAMGAEPGEAYVQLGVPADLEVAACLELADGIAEVAGRYGVEVLGGDVSRASSLVLAVTVVGHAGATSEVVRRSGARAGDVVAVTGELGGAAAGLALIERPELADAVDAELATALRARQLEPEPRIAAGRILAAAGATAMIDVSDGLGADAGHLAEASRLRVEIELETVPVADGVAAVAAAAGRDPAELAAAGGEDYELLAALPASALESAQAELDGTGVGLSRIGRAREGSGAVLRDESGAASELGGFDQLRASPGPRGHAEPA